MVNVEFCSIIYTYVQREKGRKMKNHHAGNVHPTNSGAEKRPSEKPVSRLKKCLFRLHGIRLPHKKHTANCAPERLPVPASVTIPMSMHIGKPARITIAKGEDVKVGQLIGEADGFVSSNIHASVSGEVRQIGEMLNAHGQRVPCVVIASDGKQEKYEKLTPPQVKDFDSFVKAVKESGVVGLGGAGFPSFVKLNVYNLSAVEAVVINAAECEPYITSDTRTMIDKSEYVFKGIEAVRRFMGVKRFIIGIENNKQQAIEQMQALAAKTEGVEVHVLPALYPQGGEKVLVYHTMGRVIPKGGLPLDVGVVVINVTTLAFIAEYLETGMPLVEKCLTVDGSAVNTPKNVIVPIGMSIRDVIEAAGGLKSEPSKVLYGGPMMGITVPSMDEPVLKNTNALIFMDEQEAAPPKTTACIGCGACAAHCPFRLDPRAIAKAYQLGDGAALKTLCVDLCMECGCCSYVCPAHRPLVQTNILGKSRLKEYLFSQQAQQKEETKARQRKDRQEKQEKQEKEGRK